ncbi:putative disease resistance protein [Forsythia ovata]|uniref:Disease resistance protein n=1 Tax=Forsythia ovata TaxID=205694 RepID=A0ABD1TS06_9LAMI
MAYASLLPLTQTLQQILHSDEQCQVLHQTEEQIGRSLLEKVRFFLSFLEDHSQKNIETIRCLEGRIRMAAYEAEDIIETQIDISDQIVSESKNNCEKCMEFRRHNLAKKCRNLQKVIQDLDSISEQVVNMKERNDVEILPPRNTFPAGSSKFDSSKNNDMVGFDDDLMHLLNSKSSQLLGWEALYHFHTSAWTTISQEYNVQKMLTDLLDSTSNIENLAEKLYKYLKGKRYRIVLDDMWDTKAWDEVQWLFPDDNNGSRIILTTRLADVAVYAGSSIAIHHLSLSPEKSWNLLQQTVFGEECCPCELEEIGKQIAKNCKGLPLALVVIGGLLYKCKRTHDYWMYIKQNVNSAVSGTDDQFMEILLLSYNHLPYHLRACFLYMAVFPEDYQIRKSELTKLWVAEGFIKPDRSKSLEAVAEKYVEDLLDRNMILAHERSYTGKIKVCSIHDLMRDL